MLNIIPLNEFFVSFSVRPCRSKNPKKGIPAFVGVYITSASVVVGYGTGFSGFFLHVYSITNMRSVMIVYYAIEFFFGNL